MFSHGGTIERSENQLKID